jgi:hypothetical protein
MVRRFVAAALAVVLLGPGVTIAEDLAVGLARCAGISDSLQRLVCYDTLARSVPPAPDTSAAGA